MTTSEVGYVISCNNYLVYLNGLPTITVGELVENDQKLRGLVYALHPQSVQILMLDEGSITPGQAFKRIDKLNLPMGDFLLGRSINPLGLPIDDKALTQKDIKKQTLSLSLANRGIESREFIKEQLVSGITLIDNILPLGKGQRELIIGDNHSGMDEFLLNLTVNLKTQNVICIFGLIGKPIAQIKSLIESLKINNALNYSIVVASDSSQNAPLIMLTAETALTIAEYFQGQGKDVLVILDDMGRLANIYREISLLSNTSPGREGYPADSFYLIAHLLEKAGKFNPQAGSGSITALPVMELNLNDSTGFIPTNLMAVTDGHLLFKSDLYSKNQRPAIDISESVTRVGRQTQPLVNSLLSDRIKQVISEANQLQTLSSLSQELPIETQIILNQAKILEEIFKQENLKFIPLKLQTMLLGLVFTNFFKSRNTNFLAQDKNNLMEKLSLISPDFPKMNSDQELIDLLEKSSGSLKI